VVRVAAHQLADTVELTVREAERAVERFRDLAQESIVSGKADDAEGKAGGAGRVTVKR
jgi:hypothetical protein